MMKLRTKCFYYYIDANKIHSKKQLTNDMRVFLSFEISDFKEYFNNAVQEEFESSYLTLEYIENSATQIRNNLAFKLNGDNL